MHFADRLCAAIDAKGSAVTVGLDPRPESLPPHLLADCRAELGDNVKAVAEALWRFNRGIIDAVHDVVPAVKPQIAFYERYGVAGLQAYVRTAQHAKEAGLLVIADGKRNGHRLHSERLRRGFSRRAWRLHRRCPHRQPVSGTRRHPAVR